MMVIDNKFEIGQAVYISTDTDQQKRVVTAIFVLPKGLLMYELSCATLVSKHYEFELTESESIEAKIK